MDVSRSDYKDIKHAFGRAVKILRAEKAISQEEAASRVGLERSFISLVERGEQEPRLTTIKRFADGYDIKLTELFERVERYMEQD